MLFFQHHEMCNSWRLHLVIRTSSTAVVISCWHHQHYMHQKECWLDGYSCIITSVWQVFHQMLYLHNVHICISNLIATSVTVITYIQFCTLLFLQGQISTNPPASLSWCMLIPDASQYINFSTHMWKFSIELMTTDSPTRMTADCKRLNN